MNLRKLSLALAVLLLVAVGGEAVKADNGCCGGGGWGGYGGWYPLYSRDHIPYYSLHPPVYYSYPVPRAYGWSPWAYPPGVLTPEILGELTGPQEIINPHVPKAEVKPATTNKTASFSKTEKGEESKVQVVVNPFVDQKLAGE
jgi:hypothetical protein